MRLALPLLFLALPLGAAPVELATALALAAALRARRGFAGDLLAPAAVLALCALAAAAGQGGPALRAALGVPWALALLAAVPPLLGADRERAARAGLIAAALVGALAAAQALSGEYPAKGLFSHHLTLGYALLPALAAAAQRRAWWAAAPLLAGVAASGGSGPALGAAVALAGVALGPGRALAGGLVAALALTALLRADPALAERATLWGAGASLLTAHPAGWGGGWLPAMTLAQDSLQPGFYFPHHAHDAALQAGAAWGLGAWVGWAWLLLALWRRADRAGKAAIAALVVGGMTQDTLGDLEGTRALCAWALLGAQPAAAGVVSSPRPPERRERAEEQ